MEETTLLASVKQNIDKLLTKLQLTDSIEESLVIDMQLSGLMQWLCQCRQACPLERINFACDILKEEIPQLVYNRNDLPREPGCYFFFSKSELHYIGTAKSIRQRVANRFPDSEYIAYMLIDDDSRLKVESQLILLLQPEFNVSITVKRDW